MTIDALTIWEQLAAECDEAVQYFGSNQKKEVLKQGAADFDKKVRPDVVDEKHHYRTDYYVSRCGYMNMHIQQNLAAFRCYLKDKPPQPLLLVDFGCGPMTSGLALAEVLSEQASDYKTRTAYFGIDISQNMVNKANYINQKFELFVPQYFEVVRNCRFDAQKIPIDFPAPGVLVLNLSFAFAPKTLQCNEDVQSVGQFASDWKEYVASNTQCEKTLIIYLNPQGSEESFFNSNWNTFKNAVCENLETSGRFCYTLGKYFPRFLNSSREFAAQVIIGKPKREIHK